MTTAVKEIFENPNNVADWLPDKAKKSTARTVFMDSNIALTDGSALAGSGSGNVIPNLYEAIQTMDTRIESMSTSHGPSTADAGLYIKPLVDANGKKQYANFLRNNTTDGIPGIEISVGDGFNTDDGTDKNASNPQKLETYNMHFRANEITFTVSNPNRIVKDAYLITEGSLITTTDGAVSIDTDKVRIDNTNQSTAEALIAKHSSYNVDGVLNNMVEMEYYWIPLEDDNANAHITNGLITENSHGKILVHIRYGNGYEDEEARTNAKNSIESAAATSTDPGLKQYATLVMNVINKGGTIVYASHAVVVTDAGLNIGGKKKELSVSGEMTYNLGAIIEAIQELNRRTMFMDTSVSFMGALSYNDYTKDVPDDVMHYGHVLDGLPAASDSNHIQHNGGQSA